jgi:hypothetical protein
MGHRMESEKPEEAEMEEGKEGEGGWGHHEGWGDMGKCGCPMCIWLKKMAIIRMMGGGTMGTMPDMAIGMPSMKHAGMMASICQGMGGWRKFVSSEEKIAKLE